MSNTTPDVIAERSSASSAADNRGKVVNPIKALQGFGQSVWLDYLRRSLFTSGEFGRLITEDGLRGVTSNPSIFEKAIAGSTDYLDALQEIERRRDLEPMALYETLAIRDIAKHAGKADCIENSEHVIDRGCKAAVERQSKRAAQNCSV